MDFHSTNVCDYDKLDTRVDTRVFTVLDGVEMIDDMHAFMHFLRGMTCLADYTIPLNVLHGWFHKDTETAKFLVRRPADVACVVVQAWRMFVGTHSADVYIYSMSCGELYESNEYEISKKEFYKFIIKKTIDACMDEI